MRKYKDGIEGGIESIRIISGEEAESMEPSLKKGITSALFSEDTGTVDPWELCIAAYENARDNGAEFRFGEEVTGIERCGGFIVKTRNETYHASAVINAAGLQSDRIREMTEEPLIEIRPTAADYIVLDKEPDGAVSHIIFHEGEDGKGLTIVPTIDGNILLGPVSRDADEQEISAEDMRVSTSGLEQIMSLCREIAPGMDTSQRIRNFGSLRPNPYSVEVENGEKKILSKSIKDFVALEEDGLFSLVGIKTPGMTFANELGRLIADKVASYLGIDSLNDSYDPHRKAIVRASELTPDERAELAAADPDYGIIACCCMDVTRAEIRQAIDRGADSFEGIKRRTGAGMGRCQGSRCRLRISEMLESAECSHSD